MSRIWVGYVGCGSGHKKAAEAIRDVFENREILFYFNLSDLAHPAVKFFYEQGYRLAVGYLPILWRFLYNIYFLDFSRRLLNLTNLFIFKIFADFIVRENPGVIVSTHFFISQIVSSLKERGLINSKLITVITDFGIHPLWISKNTDYYIAATRHTASILKQTYNITSDKIKTWGMPLRREFLTSTSSSLPERYKKPENLFTFLLFSSEFGIGPFKKVIEDFCNKCGIFVIYGRNSAVKRYIEALKNTLYLLAFRHKEEIWELMQLSDLVITKAGGLSIYECIAMRKPVVFMHSIYGQEAGNVDFVLKHGLGFNPETPQELITTLRNIVDDPGVLDRIHDNFKKIEVEDCALKIRELALNL